MLVCPNNAISFSAGAGSVPEDLSPILDFKYIYIAYDNDTPGREGAERLAQRIKTAFDPEDILNSGKMGTTGRGA